MLRRLSILALVLLSLTSGRLKAAPPAAAPQATAAAQPAVLAAPLVDAPPLVSRILANGLEIIVFEDHSVPLVTTELVVRNGSFTEPPELNGLSHLYEHMFFKGNQAAVNRDAYPQSLGDMGIVYNGRTTEESVNYYLTTTTPNFAGALRYLRDSARDPVFDRMQLDQEKEVVVGEIDRQESNPYSALFNGMTRTLFSRYTSRKTPAGSRETVRAATPEAMRLIQERYYVPNNAAVVITGDVTPAAAFAAAEQLFGEWRRRPVNPFTEFPLVEHPPLTASTGTVVTGPIQQVVAQIGWHGPSIGKDDAGTYAADVFLWILRQQDSGFQRALVDSGLATAAGLSYYTQRNVGPITLTLQTTPEQTRPALRAMWAEIARFNAPDYYTDEELEAAKIALEADALFDREKPSEYAHTVSFWWSSTSLDYFRGYLTRLRAVTRADIARYVSRYIQNQPHAGLALLSEEGRKTSGLTENDLIGPAGDRR
jgi:zinc protease